MTARLARAPDRLIESDRIDFGNYGGAIGDINVGEYDFTKLRRWPWTASPVLARRLFKRWQFVGVVDEDLVLGAAVAHLQYLGTGFAYVFRRGAAPREVRRLTERNLKSPLARGTEFSTSPVKGVTAIEKGRRSIRMDNTVSDEGERQLNVDFGPVLSAEISFCEHGEGVSTVTRQAMYGFHYTYKSAGLPVRGSVVLEGRRHQLSERALALIDWTASTPARQTIWNWAAGVGWDSAGRPLGINFSTGLVVSGYTQNTIWVDGAPRMLGGVNFDYHQQDILGEPWRLSTVDGAMDLSFTPEQERYENVNLALVASSLHQPFGSFRGALEPEGESVELFGFCEEHYAKW